MLKWSITHTAINVMVWVPMLIPVLGEGDVVALRKHAC